MRTPFFKDETMPFLLALIGSMILFFGVLFVLCRLYDQRQHWAVMDTQILVSVEAQKMAELYKNGKAPPEKLQAMADALKAKAQVFAKDHHLILLAKGAVWGGELPDYTQAFMNDLQENEKKETSHAPE